VGRQRWVSVDALRLDSELLTSRTRPRRQIRKPLRNHCSRWILVPLGSLNGASKSAEVWTSEKEVSIASEFRTKSAQSEGLETNGRRERILGFERCVAVRRFRREGLCLLGFPRAREPAENVGRGQTGGGKELGSNSPRSRS
jgi:hypothetical protein